MKKMNLIFILWTSFLLFSIDTPISYAEEIHSKVTGTLIQTDEENAKLSNTTSTDKDPGGKAFSELPQAGEEITWEILLLGIILVGSSLAVIRLKRKRTSHEN